mmetsp:Transcript_8191/g.11948  ORF Transcript_8191/g.11948 Transcript_8191/m.11948 type:complete len:356 (-) Transcript_8191:287-1354(-)|eukprot:CAMPEP_0194033828 /NCGR_PEP_ID=MMETSP0009_2-20130614/6348_1 /TAXON_ID=210454 /ORGANISM="Grammatophora oceanica, Strain CCMP 410" /LENGTH=355 /DNA_ID=CAMNT_0038674555 /DNA_START=51 /DNA_END=1118 /DNA_ORIENTATION=+
MMRSVFQRGAFGPHYRAIQGSKSGLVTSALSLRVPACVGCWQAFSSESSEEVLTEDKVTDDTESSTTDSKAEEKPLPAFPWKSSEEPVDRIQEGNDLSGLPKSSRTRYFRPLLVASELNVPLWEALISSGWRYELAQDFSYAFQKGVAGLLSWKYQVPMELIDLDENGVVFDSNIKNEIGTKQSAEGKDFFDTYDDGEASRYVSGILESKLVDLYKDVPERLRLEMKPIGVPHIESTYVVPALTRAAVDRDPTLKGLYSRLEREIHEQGMGIGEMEEQAAKLIEKTGSTTSVRTIFADVSVNCMELFGTDEKEPSEVTHLVRFEMQTERGDRGQRVPTKWRIVDWDDLLGGNSWA